LKKKKNKKKKRKKKNKEEERVDVNSNEKIIVRTRLAIVDDEILLSLRDIHLFDHDS